MSVKSGFLLAACLVSLCGCSTDPKPARIEGLSTTDREGNAVKIAQMVDQQCLRSPEDLKVFEKNLQATGWAAKRTQAANPENRLDLDVWELPHTTLIRGQPVKGGVWTCALTVASDAKPSEAKMNAALSAVANHKTQSGGEWRWKPVRSREVRMSLSAGNAESAMMVNVEIYVLPWWRGILG